MNLLPSPLPQCPLFHLPKETLPLEKANILGLLQQKRGKTRSGQISDLW